MAYRVIDSAQTEPVSLDEARLHLRLGDDETSEDALILQSITTARKVAEHYAGRSLVAKTLEMALDSFPGTMDAISLDLPPVVTVTSIKYDDFGGVEQTLPADGWHFSPYGEAPRYITPTYAHWWPPTRPKADAVRITYTVGADCPEQAKQAMLLIVGHLYENRQEVVTDTRQVAIEIPMGAQSLLDSLRVYG